MPKAVLSEDWLLTKTAEQKHTNNSNRNTKPQKSGDHYPVTTICYLRSSVYNDNKIYKTLREIGIFDPLMGE